MDKPSGGVTLLVAAPARKWTASCAGEGAEIALKQLNQRTIRKLELEFITPK